MPFQPVRFEPLSKMTGYVEAVTDETLNVVGKFYFPDEDDTPYWFEFLKTALPAEEVAKCQAGTYIDLDLGYHYDKYGTCRRGLEFRADVRGVWTAEDLEKAKKEAQKLADELGWGL